MVGSRLDHGGLWVQTPSRTRILSELMSFLHVIFLENVWWVINPAIFINSDWYFFFSLSVPRRSQFSIGLSCWPRGTDNTWQMFMGILAPKTIKFLLFLGYLCEHRRVQEYISSDVRTVWIRRALQADWESLLPIGHNVLQPVLLRISLPMWQ